MRGNERRLIFRRWNKRLGVWGFGFMRGGECYGTPASLLPRRDSLQRKVVDGSFLC